MAQNRGKQFEGVVKEAFEKVPETAVIRLHDQTTGFAGSTNICDFVVYHKPFLYCIECKSISGNTFPLSNLTDNQYEGLLRMSKIDGVIAGVLIWWTDRDVTKFVPVQTIKILKDAQMKSIKYNLYSLPCQDVPGKKKRIFFDYNMAEFLERMEVLQKVWNLQELNSLTT